MAATESTMDPMTFKTRYPDQTIKCLRAILTNYGRKDKISQRTFVKFFLVKHGLTVDTVHPGMYCLLQNTYISFDEKNKKYLTFDELILNLEHLSNGTPEDIFRSVFKICNFKKQDIIEKGHIVTFFQSLSFMEADLASTSQVTKPNHERLPTPAPRVNYYAEYKKHMEEIHEISYEPVHNDMEQTAVVFLKRYKMVELVRACVLKNVAFGEEQALTESAFVDLLKRHSEERELILQAVKYLFSVPNMG